LLSPISARPPNILFRKVNDSFNPICKKLPGHARKRMTVAIRSFSYGFPVTQWDAGLGLEKHRTGSFFSACLLFDGERAQKFFNGALPVLEERERKNRQSDIHPLIRDRLRNFFL